MRSYRILQGDALGRLREMQDESVQCCVTSPPYWGLRQYLFKGAVVMRPDLSHEQREDIEALLRLAGVNPKC